MRELDLRNEELLEQGYDTHYDSMRERLREIDELEQQLRREMWIEERRKREQEKEKEKEQEQEQEEKENRGAQ